MVRVYLAGYEHEGFRMRKTKGWRGCVLLLAILGWAGTGVWAGPPQPATDAEIEEMIAAAGDAEDFGNANLVYVLDEADVYVQDSGLATTESCQVIKVLTDAGVRSQARLRQEFDPDTNRVTIKAVRIHRADGTKEDVDVSAVITQPAPQSMIYWGNKQHVLGLPRVEVGDALEIRISKIGFNIAYLAAGDGGPTGAGGEVLQPPMPGHWYETTLFQGNSPIVKKRYAVHMPKDKPVQYEVYNGKVNTSLWFEEDYHVYTFWDEDIPAVKREPHMVALDDCVPKVVMATVPDWETKSRWFYEVNEPQFEADDAIRAKVAELTDHLEDEEAKIEACLHWSADYVRYYGTSRGPREGFTLHTGIETFHDKGGVCKDKAGMLITMMRVLGCEVYPALTMAGSRVEEIPADQFNHTVTVQRMKDGSFRILDPTWSPLSREMWSSREALQHLVYGTPEGQGLTRSPYYPPEHNGIWMRAESKLDAEGNLATDVQMDLKGYACTYLRRNVNRYPVPERRAAFEHVLNVAPNARIEEFSFTDPYDYSRDSEMKMKIKAEGYAAGAGNVRMFRLPLMSHPLEGFLIPDFGYDVSAESRKFGMRMRATRLISYEETVELPRGWKIERLPEAKELDSGSASLSFEASADGSKLTYKFELVLQNHQIPAADYAGFKEAVEAMNELTDTWIVCSKDS